MNELGHIMMIELKFFQLEQVLDIAQVTCYQVVHRHYFKAFLYKSVAEV